MAPTAVEPPLPDEVLEEIFLRLGAAEDLARASAACTTFRRVACAGRFLRRYRSLYPPPILGFVPSRTLLLKHPIHLAQPPHRHARAARALAQAAHPAFSFLPYAGRCTVHDARDGRVLLSRNLGAIAPHGLVVCDPVHRRYVRIPRIPGDLVAPTGYDPKTRFETFLAPALEAEDDSSFRVLCNVLSQDKVVALLFSSVTRTWCHLTSFTFPPDAKIQHYDSVRHYARSCFYWTMHSWDKMLVLGMREFKFSVSDLPSGISRYQGVGIVDGGDDKIFLFTPKDNILDQYCGTLGDNAVGVEGWQHKRMIPLPELNCRWFVIGATEGHLLLESDPNDVPILNLAQVQRPCFTVDYKTLLVERMCVSKQRSIRAAHLYASFPPPLSPPSI